MQKDKLIAIPVTAYECGDTDFDHDFTVLWQTEYFDREAVVVGGEYRFVPVEEFAITTVMVADSDWWTDGPRYDYHCEGELDFSELDNIIRELVTDELFDRERDPEWMATYENICIGQMHDISNPFGKVA